ncbi:MAG: hypothetical protein PHZ00_00200 [Candidatus Peribacteraceae bacterium]|nr:hypothetical protein [Candidatus Peribacteraceae bacterium]
MPPCTHCQSAFTVQPAEKEFLKGIDMPLPSLCPTCRRQQRFAWRNERKLYHRKCDLTGKQIISVYSPDSPYKVYDQHEWHTDKWDGQEQGRDYNFNRPFFEQFNELMLATPKISVFTSQNVNSDFTNGAQQDKNCYMIFVSDHNEECYYSYGIDSCTSCIECLNCFKSTLLMECIDCSESYNLAFSERSHNCRDSFFLSDCKGCADCFGCFGLRNKEFHIFNEPHSKEDFRQKLKELNTGNLGALDAATSAFRTRAGAQQIHQYYDGNGNENVTGDHIVNCRNCTECYDSGDLEDCGYLIFSFKSKDCWDGHVVVDHCERTYGTISTIGQYNTQFTFVSFYSKNSQYLDHCQYCEDCFACSGLKKKRYCILNKQYSKEEYEKLKAKIVSHMKKSGEWGLPLPPSLSPFGYNETVAQEYFPLTQKEAEKRGWKWKEDTDSQTSAYQGPNSRTPDDIRDVPDDIVQKILTCAKTGKPFKIIPQELALYREHNLPLPRLCFDERHVGRIRRRNPRQLWKRECMKCGKELESSYEPSKPEKIYCEECYLKEVY